MRLRLLIIPGDEGEMPSLIEAVDEYVENTWGGVPDFFTEKIANNPEARQVFINVDDNVISAQFDPATLQTTWDWREDV